MANETSADAKGTCFVVMGFGKKTDFESGRTLDLNLTYQYIIKPAVSAAGLKCVRADEIIHSGPIDVPMYEQLLHADLVIADLSTSNKNAYYELGVRHALRPYSTIVICEDGVKAFPFDVNHVLIRQYRHMGDGIDYGEVERFRKELTTLIGEVCERRAKDSPVYTFLSRLSPPDREAALHAVAQGAAAGAPAAAQPAQASKLYSELMREVDAAQAAKDFGEARSLLKLVRKRMKPADPSAPEDPYILQRLALLTYKAPHANQELEVAALREAVELLRPLKPATSNDTETLGLWGAIHKRLWDRVQDKAALDESIRSYERGFYLRNDYYNGINFAYLLNVRASDAFARVVQVQGTAAATQLRAEAIADFVSAQRVRREVIEICDESLREQRSDPAGVYWLTVTKAEACLGADQAAAAEALYEEAFKLAPEPWMVETSKEQRNKLSGLLALSPLALLR